MKYAVVAWLEFFVGFAVLAAVNSWLRSQGGWMSDEVWFGVPALLGAVALPLLWISTASVRRPAVRAAIVVGHVALGFALYLMSCLWYVVGTGLDSP